MVKSRNRKMYTYAYTHKTTHTHRETTTFMLQWDGFWHSIEKNVDPYALMRCIMTLCSSEMHFDLMFQGDALWPVAVRCILTLCSSEMQWPYVPWKGTVTLCSTEMHYLWLYVPVRHIVILWSSEDEEDFSRISKKIKQTTTLANQLLCRLLRADNRTIMSLINYNRSTLLFPNEWETLNWVQGCI